MFPGLSGKFRKPAINSHTSHSRNEAAARRRSSSQELTGQRFDVNGRLILQAGDFGLTGGWGVV